MAYCSNCGGALREGARFCAACGKAVPGPSEPSADRAGFVEGKYYLTYLDKVKALKRRGRLPEAETLLLKLIQAVEAESRAKEWGVAPWYYEQLAIVYRKQKKYAEEVDILERYAVQRHAPGANPPKLVDRLLKARELRDVVTGHAK